MRLQMSLAGMAVVVSSMTAHAAISSQVVQSSSSVSGYVTSQLMVTTDTDWLTGQALIVLSSGSVYDHAFGSNNAAPNPALVAAFPDLAYDSYVQAPNGNSASLASGAVNLGGGVPSTWNSTKIDAGWLDGVNNDIGTFSIGQFTLSSDANGTFAFRVAAAGTGNVLVYSGTISNGQFILAGGSIPEPATVGVLGLAGIGMLLKPRRSRS